MISSVDKLLLDTSASLIGGDRVLSSPAPFDSAVYQSVKDNDLESTTAISFYSMLTTDQNFVLVDTKAVDTNYPVRGRLYIDGAPTLQVPEVGTIWVEKRVLLLLGIEVGDHVQMGDKKFTVASVLTLEPDRVSEGFSFAPRALMNLSDLEGAGLLQPGSRINYRLLVAGDPSDLAAFDTQVKISADQKMQVAGSTDNVSDQRLQQAVKYLGLAILINIVLGAVVIGIVSQSYNARHIKDVAIMRCLGANSRQIIGMYMINLLLISVVCGVVGSLCGYALHHGLATLLDKSIDLQLPNPTFTPVFLGLSCSILLIVGLALPSLLSLRNVSPLQVLRNGGISTDNLVWFVYWLIATLFICLLYIQAGDVELFRLIVVSIAAAIFFSLLVVQLLFKFVPKLIPKLPAIVRISLTNIVSSSSANSLQLLVFALVISIALMLFIVRTDLLNTWRNQIPQNAPNYFVVNLDADNLDLLHIFLEKNEISVSEFYPIVRGQLTQINDQAASMWRRLNITWTSNLPKDNTILAGSWNEAGLSVEIELANRLGVKLGDRMTFEIDLQPKTATVTSIRAVEWGSFTPNFYVIYPPQLMNGVAASYMASFYVPHAKQAAMIEMVKLFPEINVLSIDTILDQALLIIELVSVFIAYIWTFTLIVGVLLLLVVMLNSVAMRNYQNNLMRVLGASRAQLRSIFLIELLLLGSVAGLIGTLVAIAVGKYVATRLFQISYPVDLWVILAGCAIGMLLMVLGGMLGTRKALHTAPIQLLRNLH